MADGQRVVGVIGAGQLARMMAQAAIPLDIRIVLLAADANDGAAQVVPEVIIGSPDDPACVQELARRCDVVTFDHELVDPGLLATLERDGHTVWPSSASMALAQDKRRQRRELGSAGHPVPKFADLDSWSDVSRFAADVGFPFMIKASRGGYDGRGVWTVETEDAALAIWQDAQAHGAELLAEERLALDLEFAILLARNPAGEVAVYPPIETVQQAGICRELHVPADLDPTLAAEADRIAREIAASIQIVGILAIEFFVTAGRVVVNELAPRPHNSGHWSIEGSTTSQFEQHLRAVLGLPLGSTTPTAPAIATINVLGRGDSDDPRRLLPEGLKVPGAHIHLYGKAPRSGRKVGHVTAVGTTRREVRTVAMTASERIGGAVR